tara:strand:+ start:747 stop:851 length:105 start_codon:yes stop_codon:yes gene_type:complete
MSATGMVRLVRFDAHALVAHAGQIIGASPAVTQK